MPGLVQAATKVSLTALTEFVNSDVAVSPGQEWFNLDRNGSTQSGMIFADFIQYGHGLKLLCSYGGIMQYYKEVIWDVLALDDVAWLV
jgi:hypothetical protein